LAALSLKLKQYAKALAYNQKALAANKNANGETNSFRQAFVSLVATCDINYSLYKSNNNIEFLNKAYDSSMEADKLLANAEAELFREDDKLVFSIYKSLLTNISIKNAVSYNYSLSFINADLATLSACETGLGKMAFGEGIVGLTRSFLYAGASNLLVSQWKVNVESTSDMMVDFYDKILSGTPKTQALREAKLSILKNDKFKNPYYWAPFVLIGE